MILYPSRLKGNLTVPPSKSIAHRALICAGMASGISQLYNVETSEDILATLTALKQLGIQAEINGKRVQVTGGLKKAAGEINCGESGSTLRFILPISLLTGGGSFAGRGNLMQRPLEPYFELFRAQGIDDCWEKGNLILQGYLQSGTYELPGNVSSQFVSGLLLALPTLTGDSQIQLSSPLESKAYVDMTLDIMKQFGVVVEETKNTYRIPGGQSYHSSQLFIEGDYSQAAFFLVANELGSQVKVTGLPAESYQGDQIITQLMKAFRQPGYIELDVAQFPDLMPILALLASQREGQTTVFVQAGRLRIKESDRLAAMEENLKSLGVSVRTGSEHMEILGRAGLTGGEVKSFGDHRIAMTIGIAATVAQGILNLDKADCVKKSYPAFWQEYARLGGKVK